jgi:hypothetical protein
MQEMLFQGDILDSRTCPPEGGRYRSPPPELFQQFSNVG